MAKTAILFETARKRNRTPVLSFLCQEGRPCLTVIRPGAGTVQFLLLESFCVNKDVVIPGCPVDTFIRDSDRFLKCCPYMGDQRGRRLSRSKGFCIVIVSAQRPAGLIGPSGKQVGRKFVQGNELISSSVWENPPYWEIVYGNRTSASI